MYTMTIGIDEVGRGCWAGPLVAGAVALPDGLRPGDCPVLLRDSKKMSKKQRAVAASWIHDQAADLGIGWVTPAEVDDLGITEAVRLAMQRALAEISIPYDEVIIDGNINYFADNPKVRAVIKADDSMPCVSAASIVAKVARDAYMTELDSKYIGYGFAQHVGYGTTAHIAALKSLGVTDIHRRSYKPIKALMV